MRRKPDFMDRENRKRPEFDEMRRRPEFMDMENRKRPEFDD